MQFEIWKKGAVLSTHESIISTMISAGIKAIQSYRYLSKVVGGLISNIVKRLKI